MKYYEVPNFYLSGTKITVLLLLLVGNELKTLSTLLNNPKYFLEFVDDLRISVIKYLLPEY